MTKIAPLIVCLLCSLLSFAQVGINTSNPTSTLDVNGNIRIRTLSVDQGVATKLIGVDDIGNMMEIEVEEGVVLENNKLRAADRFERISEPFEINISVGNNVNFIILPGEPNDEKTVIRITSTLSSIEISGIQAAQHGQRIKLYPTTGDLSLSVNDTGSLPGNRILAHNNGMVTVRQYQMVELMYDGLAGGWIIASRH